MAVRKMRGKLQYRIKWLGFDDDSVWYPASDLTNAFHKFKDYHITNLSKPGPPKQLQAWIRQWENNEKINDNFEDDQA